jgi:hypothetical protein
MPAESQDEVISAGKGEMGMPEYREIRMGQVVQLRKPHPCGSDKWVVVRLGTDIGIRCLGCGRRVLLPRSTFLKRVKKWLDEQLPDTAGASPPRLP